MRIRVERALCKHHQSPDFKKPGVGKSRMGTGGPSLVPGSVQREDGCSM